jgi:hypothetical protein
MLVSLSQRVGFISLALGMFISVLFGFIFGLILGTTEMPWGFGDFPTEEMKGRYGLLAFFCPRTTQLWYEAKSKQSREAGVAFTRFPLLRHTNKDK